MPATERSGQSRTVDPPTRKIRILVVDDSVVVRRLIAHALAGDDAIEVIGSAWTAEAALGKIPLLKPDVLTLDIHMPGMTGLELLPILRQRHPEICVLIVSSLTVEGAATTIDSLLLGAWDYLCKPGEGEPLAAALERLRTELVPKIKQFFQTGAATVSPATPQQRSARQKENAEQTGPVPHIVKPAKRVEPEVLAIGVSTGGPAALTVLLSGLPAEFPLPILIVQHMPPLFTALLAERLRHATGVDVVEAKDGVRLLPRRAILAPGNFHMRVCRSNLGGFAVQLDQGPQECSCRPSVDVLFRSVREAFGPASIAAVLTGMGQDGLRGAEAIRSAGGHVIAQDQATSVVWGMPGAVVGAGLAHEVTALGSIMEAVQRRIEMR